MFYFPTYAPAQIFGFFTINNIMIMLETVNIVVGVPTGYLEDFVNEALRSKLKITRIFRGDSPDFDVICLVPSEANEFAEKLNSSKGHLFSSPAYLIGMAFSFKE